MHLAARARQHDAAIRWISLGVLLLSVLWILYVLPLVPLTRALGSWVERLGPWGMLVYGLIYVALALLLVPGSVLTIAAGALFGLFRATALVSAASVTAAAVAFLIARHLARNKLERYLTRQPKFQAIDQAIADGGWKIVGLLRLSPVVPFGIQNYLYGLTRLGFWETVVTSWLAMLPGTFLYVYLGYIGRTGVEATIEQAPSASGVEWMVRSAGLAATLGVVVYVTSLARKALRRTTEIHRPAGNGKFAAQGSDEGIHMHDRLAGNGKFATRRSQQAIPLHQRQLGWPWGPTWMAALALVALAGAIYAQLHAHEIGRAFEGLSP